MTRPSRSLLLPAIASSCSLPTNPLAVVPQQYGRRSQRDSSELQRRQRRRQCTPNPSRCSCGSRPSYSPGGTQNQHMQAAQGNPELRASANHGEPPVAATGRPGEFSGHEAVPARQAGGVYNPPANRGTAQPRSQNGGRPATAVHPKGLPPMERPPAPNTGNAKTDQKHQQQHRKLQQKQDQERQKLQQQREKEHQQIAKQNANEAKKQQTEQKHQQQNRQLQQRHFQQPQNLQQRQGPPSRLEPKPPKGK